MRIPFDLIAAVLCVEALSRYLLDLARSGRSLERTQLFDDANAVTPGFAALTWLGFFAIAWLLNELVTRRTEWRTRFGHHISGFGGGAHPIVSHTWGTRAAQTLTVLVFAGVLWTLKWPLWITQWPQWLGMAPDAKLGRMMLMDSSLAAIPLNLAPFLMAMIVGWMPRRRMLSGIRGRTIPLLPYIGYEARLTWIPLAMGVVLSIFSDLASILPRHYTEWSNTPLFGTLSMIAVIAFVSIIGLPKLIVWLWQCKPIPEGELKNRVQALMDKSGVKASQILVWGPRSSGLLNACILGVWSRYRYVLISPSLLDELSMEETEAVMAHELGHARYGHLGFLFVMILCLSALMHPLMGSLPESWQKSPVIEVLVLLSFILVYIGVFFGTIMRQCEREADLASAELMGTPVPLVSALEKLACITGNIRNVWCWHHGSIAERVAAVTHLSTAPDDSQRLHTRLRRVRIAFTVVTVLVLGIQIVTQL
jgi:Zn-dependent protease with chaperone function